MAAPSEGTWQRRGAFSLYELLETWWRHRISFLQAHALYRKRRWEEAQKTFQSILDKWPDDGPSRTYWKRCQDYLFDEPPTGWDGVFTMTHK
jgi:hypothetical protein